MTNLVKQLKVRRLRCQPAWLTLVDMVDTCKLQVDKHIKTERIMKNIGLDENRGSHRKRKTTCPKCRKKGVWTRYYNFDQGTYLPEQFGRCDREINCGHHSKPPRTLEDGTVVRIDRAIMNKTLCRYESNNLCTWLADLFGMEETVEVFARYNVGSSLYAGGSTVFWQVDMRGSVRTGKVIKYNADGHRCKDTSTNWVHQMMNFEKFELDQCLFGEHLLNEEGKKDLPVMLYESEKTAMMAELYEPDQMINIACGSMHGLGGKSVNWQKVKCLDGRTVILVPDASIDGKCYKAWEHLMKQMNASGFDVHIENLDAILPDKQRADGFDYGDMIEYAQKYGDVVPPSLVHHDDPTKEYYLPF